MVVINVGPEVTAGLEDLAAVVADKGVGRHVLAERGLAFALEAALGTGDQVVGQGHVGADLARRPKVLAARRARRVLAGKMVVMPVGGAEGAAADAALKVCRVLRLDVPLHVVVPGLRLAAVLAPLFGAGKRQAK